MTALIYRYATYYFVCLTSRAAVILFGCVCPSTSSCPFVVNQTSRAGDSVVISINAEEKFITDFDILMSKVTVLTWTILTWLRSF